MSHNPTEQPPTSSVSPQFADASPSYLPTQHYVSRRKSPLYASVPPSSKKNTDSLTRILRICWLLAESLVANQDSAGPLPSSARRTSPQCHVAPPCHRCGMPVLEANITPAKICEFRWRRLADAVINQVSTTVSMLPAPGGVRVVNSPVYSIDAFRERLLSGLDRFYICIHSTQLLL